MKVCMVTSGPSGTNRFQTARPGSAVFFLHQARPVHPTPYPPSPVTKQCRVRTVTLTACLVFILAVIQGIGGFTVRFLHGVNAIRAVPQAHDA